MKETAHSEKQLIIADWVRLYSDELYHWCAQRIKDESAQDIVQETFITAFQHFDGFKQASSPKTWLYSILKNKVADHYRMKIRKKTPSSAEVSLDDPDLFDRNEKWKKEHRPQFWLVDKNLLDDPDFEKVLHLCLGKLPEVWGACVNLKYLSEKDTASICQELNITTSNLWQVIHRAKLNLRSCLNKNWFNV